MGRERRRVTGYKFGLFTNKEPGNYLNEVGHRIVISIGLVSEVFKGTGKCPARC